VKSSKHKESQKNVRDDYRRIGWFAAIEYFLYGKKIDVLAQNIKSKYIIANEIELSPRHCLANIKADLKVGCNEVVVICQDRPMLEIIRQKAKANLNQSTLEKVKFRTIKEFIPLK
jgi:hypothetical protein